MSGKLKGLSAPTEVISKHGNFKINKLTIFNVIWKLLKTIVAISIFIIIWLAIVIVFNFPPYLVPSPDLVAVRLVRDINVFFMHTAVTAIEALLGWLVGCTFGAVAGIILHRSRNIQTRLLPVLIGLQSVPIVALAPLLVLWLGTGLTSKLAMAAIICFVPVTISLLVAFDNVPKEYRELFAVYRAGYRTTVLRLLLPASAPAALSGLKIAGGLAVVGAIVAEMTGADRGIGYLILNGAYRLETEVMFVAILLSGLLGFAFFHLPDLLAHALPRRWGGKRIHRHAVKG
jgi:ABC-type nitrate/sulfonate/bicarbonate transport system permease component